MMTLPAAWRPLLADEVKAPYFAALKEFVAEERAVHEVFPPENEVFAALKHTAPEAVKAVILGQDPYHGAGQAHGLCFSVRPGVRKPPSLNNIFKELHADEGCDIPKHGCLVTWADAGVLMLNTVLTVRAGKPASHKGKGWEKFTDAVIRAVNEGERRVVFLLWGAHAQAKKKLIDTEKHAVLEAAHPSPLATKPFAGCRHFSTANALLKEWDEGPIDWCIPDTVTLP